MVMTVLTDRYCKERDKIECAENEGKKKKANMHRELALIVADCIVRNVIENME